MASVAATPITTGDTTVTNPTPPITTVTTATVLKVLKTTPAKKPKVAVHSTSIDATSKVTG